MRELRAATSAVIVLIAFLYGCAGTAPDTTGMADNVRRLQAEADMLSEGQEAAYALDASRALSSEAANENDKSLAAAKLDASEAAAHTALAASTTQRIASQADSLRRRAAESERDWEDAIQMLEQTEKAAERSAKGIARTAPPDTVLIELPPIPSPPGDSSAAAMDMVEEASRWNEAATHYRLPMAETYGRFLDAYNAAHAPKVKDDVRTQELNAASWTLTEMAHRVHAEALRRQGQASLSRALDLAAQRDQAVWAMVDLERTMKESARTQLEETRSKLADREQDLYNSLKQFEGKFATIRQEARGTIMSLSDILFDFNKADLRQEAQLNLAKVSVILMQYPEMLISVEGHTDNVGSEDYNLKLSEKRAKSVYDFLVSQGVAADHLDTKGFGMSQPVASNETAEGRQKNRRVDMVIRGE